MLHGHYTDVYEMKYGNSLASSGRFGGSINCDNHAWHVEWMYICVCVSFGVNRPMCEIKRHLLLGRKAMTNLDNVLKNRDITLPTKVHLVKAMIVSSSMYGCES